MKFILLISAVFMAQGSPQHHTSPGFTWRTRAACEAAVFDVDRRIRALPGLHASVEQFACIQIGGPVPKFPVRERIAEGWERA